MLKDKKIAVVMPSYNAAKTIEKTYGQVVAQDIVDTVIIVDDASKDNTLEIAKGLRDKRVKTVVVPLEKNSGYGANQKKCYDLALSSGADIIIMVHADYQYTPELIPAMAGMIVNGLYSCVLGSRILGGGALNGGMPLWKYFANRLLTAVQNFIIGTKISEFHTGYRAFSRELLEKISYKNNSNNFVFDSEIIAQVLWHGGRIGEVSCPTSYFPEASVISFKNCVIYGIGCLKTACLYRAAKTELVMPKIFMDKNG